MHMHTHTCTQDVVLAEAVESNGCDRWHAALLLMGGDHAELSMNVRAAEERQRGRERGVGGAGGEGAPSV